MVYDPSTTMFLLSPLDTRPLFKQLTYRNLTKNSTQRSSEKDEIRGATLIRCQKTTLLCFI